MYEQIAIKQADERRTGICALLASYAACMIVTQNASLTLEEGPDRLSRNVGTELRFYPA